MLRLLVASIWLYAACATNISHADALVYIGTRAEGAGTGIVAARLNQETGRLIPLGLAAEIGRPTWLLAHPRLSVLYAVSDVDSDKLSEASVFGFAVDKTTGKLSVVNKMGAGGVGATHLAMNADSSAMFVANFGSGQVSWLPVAPDGSLGRVLSLQSNYGSGPHRRQTSPHAHGVAVEPSQRFVLVTDLGADRVFVYRFDMATRQLTPAATPFVALRPGSGPRHLAFHPQGRFVFVVNELSAEVISYRWDSKHARLRSVQTLSIDEPGFSGTKSASHIAVSRDGRYVYVSNRGADAIVVYELNAGKGTLQEVQRVSSQGKTPWDFALDPSGRWMLVANLGSNAVAVLAISSETGKLSATQESLATPQPSNVTFLPR